jgi:hypothetical protein
MLSHKQEECKTCLGEKHGLRLIKRQGKFVSFYGQDTIRTGACLEMLVFFSIRESESGIQSQDTEDRGREPGAGRQECRELGDGRLKEK